MWIKCVDKNRTENCRCIKRKRYCKSFWDVDEYYYNNPNHEAGEFLRTQSDKWKEIDFEGVGNYFNQEKDSFNVIFQKIYLKLKLLLLF